MEREWRALGELNNYCGEGSNSQAEMRSCEKRHHYPRQKVAVAVIAPHLQDDLGKIGFFH